MLKQTPFFALAFVSGAALAGPLTNAVGGLLGASGAGTAPVGLTGIAAMPMATLATAERGLAVVTSSAPLPGLGGSQPQSEDGLILPDGTLPIEATVLDDGPANTGYDTVVGLGGTNVIGAGDGAGDDPGVIDLFQTVLDDLNPDNEAFGTPYLIGDGGEQPNIDAAVFDGDGTANAADGTGGMDSGIGAAVGSGNNTGNGTIGVAVLSDNRDGSSGNGTVLGVSALNRGDPLTISFMGEDVASRSDAPGASGGDPLGLLSASINDEDNTGNGGMIALSLFSGSNTGQGDLIGLAVLSGDNAGSGPIAIGVLSGDNSATTNEGLVGGGLLAVTVLNGDNSGNGERPNDGDINDAPIFSINALSGSGSSADGDGGLGLIGPGDGNITALGKGGTAIGGGGGGGGGGNGGSTGPGGGNPESETGGTDIGDGSQVADGSNNSLCTLLVKDARGKVTQRIKARCSSLRTPKA